MSDEQGRYVIWSEEHGAWWRPGRHGYTRELSKAGRYSKADADQIVANKHLPSFVPFDEVAFPAPAEGQKNV